MAGLAHGLAGLRAARYGRRRHLPCPAAVCESDLHARTDTGSAHRAFCTGRSAPKAGAGTRNPAARGRPRPVVDTPGFRPGVALLSKPFEQVSFEIGFPGLSFHHERRYAMMLLNFIVGGGASSRLFQRLREERGLAYSVYSSHEAAAGTGLFTVSASVAPTNQQEVLREIRHILDGLCHGEAITPAELERARAQIKASVILGMETVASRAYYAGPERALFRTGDSGPGNARPGSTRSRSNRSSRSPGKRSAGPGRMRRRGRSARPGRWRRSSGR